MSLVMGTVFADDYRIEGVLDAGGVGVLYEATQLSSGAKRAVKVMRPDLLADAKMKERFVQEARIGATIPSDHVVQVFAADIDAATSTPYLVMELLQGENLHAYIKRIGRVSPESLPIILEQVCHAVGAAHALGISHQTLTPENIFISPSRSVELPFFVKVLDFGIAKVLAEGETARMTSAQGKPFWMAPEQLSREAVVGPEADVWALGLIAFFCLTGRIYWASGDVEDASFEQILRETLLEPMPPASERAAQYGVHLDTPWFDAWFARCTARSPSERFSSAKVAHEAISSRSSLGTMAVHIGAAMPPMDMNGFGPSHPMPSSMDSLALGAPDAVLSESERSMSSGPLHPRNPGSTVRVSGTSRWVLATLVTLTTAMSVAGFLFGFKMQRAVLQHGMSPPKAVSWTIRSFLPFTRWTPAPTPLPDDMVRIPEGTFVMEENDREKSENPVHHVQIAAFEMDRTEVTVKAYETCVDAGVCTPGFRTIYQSGRFLRMAQCNYEVSGRESHPINCVKWEQAKTYCAWVGKRLPTEEEWEYAARGTDERVYPWGSEHLDPMTDSLYIPKACWNRKSERWVGTCPVASFADGQSPFGVFDMGGNVWEWTASKYSESYGKSPVGDARVARGGGWFDEDPAFLSTSARLPIEPSLHFVDIGFRCVR